MKSPTVRSTIRWALLYLQKRSRRPPASSPVALPESWPSLQCSRRLHSQSGERVQQCLLGSSITASATIIRFSPASNTCPNFARAVSGLKAGPSYTARDTPATCALPCNSGLAGPGMPVSNITVCRALTRSADQAACRYSDANFSRRCLWVHCIDCASLPCLAYASNVSLNSPRLNLPGIAPCLKYRSMKRSVLFYGAYNSSYCRAIRVAELAALDGFERHGVARVRRGSAVDCCQRFHGNPLGPRGRA